MLDEFERAFFLLALHPLSGHARPELNDAARMRFWSVHSRLVAYLPATKPLFIVRILHGSRATADLRDELSDG